MALFLNKKLNQQMENLNPMISFRKNTKLSSFHKKTTTFLSSYRGTKSQRESLSFERLSNFSSIKKNITCPPISQSSRSNEILMINCMNSPLALKKMNLNEEPMHSVKKLTTLESNQSNHYNDVNESNRVYYDRQGDIEKEIIRIETINSQNSEISDKVPQFRSETNRTSEIIEEYSDLMSKNSKYRKQSNPSQTSQRYSSYTNFEQNLPYNNSSKNMQMKDNKSSRQRYTNEMKFISSNSIMTQTQAILQNYFEKFSRSYERKTKYYQKIEEKRQEFDLMHNFKYYFTQNNIENIIKTLK